MHTRLFRSATEYQSATLDLDYGQRLCFLGFFVPVVRVEGYLTRSVVFALSENLIAIVVE
jgi:hypothetical protein